MCNIYNATITYNKTVWIYQKLKSPGEIGMLIKLYWRALILKNFLFGLLQYSIPPTIAKNKLIDENHRDDFFSDDTELLRLPHYRISQTIAWSTCLDE